MANIAPKLKKKSKARHYLAEWRKRRQLTQEQLADRVNCSRGLISQYESGITEIPEGMVYNLADALAIDPGDIFNINPEKEGEVVDLLRMLRDKDLDTVRAILAGLPSKTGTDK